MTRVSMARQAASAPSTPGRNSNSSQLLTSSERRRSITPSRSRKTAGTGASGKQRLPGGDGDGMFQQRVTVLDDAVDVARFVDRRIDRLQHSTAGKADEAHRAGAHQASRAYR